MSVPVRRQTHGKTRRRRAHHAISGVSLSNCPKCDKPIQPHHACEFCGFYGTKQVVDNSRDTERALRRQQKEEASTDIETTASAAPPADDMAGSRQADDGGKKKAQVNQAVDSKTDKPGK